MLPELKAVFDWMESNKNSDPRELEVEEVRNFYNDFEHILLEAWGEMSADGLHFRKSGKFEFEESALFNGCMIMFVTQPKETAKLLEGILPTDLFELVQNANPEQVEALARTRTEEKDAEIARLKVELEARDN